MTTLPPSAFDEADQMFRRELERWVNNGELPQSRFLMAMLGGDEEQAYQIGSDSERARLTALRGFLKTLDERCWGSPGNMGEWLHAGGLAGKRKVMDEYERAMRRDPPK